MLFIFPLMISSKSTSSYPHPHPYDSEEQLDENASCGDEAIERVAAGLGGKAVADAVLAVVTTYAADADWTKRRAAVAGMCRLAEGAAKHFKKFFKQSLAFLATAMQDPAHRVKFEALQTVGRFASLFPSETKTLVTQFLPTLAGLLQSAAECDRTRGHAASAMINLLSPDGPCDAEFLEPFLDPLLAAVSSSFGGAPPEVQAPCLDLIGCVSQVYRRYKHQQ
jgi:hypothetical protein